MFEDILEGYQEPDNEEKTPGIPEYEDPTNTMGLSLDESDNWDADDDWDAGESWSTSDPDDVWRT